MPPSKFQFANSEAEWGGFCLQLLLTGAPLTVEGKVFVHLYLQVTLVNTITINENMFSPNHLPSAPSPASTLHLNESALELDSDVPSLGNRWKREFQRARQGELIWRGKVGGGLQRPVGWIGKSCEKGGGWGSSLGSWGSWEAWEAGGAGGYVRCWEQRRREKDLKVFA